MGRGGRSLGLALAFLLIASGCALQRSAARDSYFGKELTGYAFPKGCMDLWPSVLKLLGGKGYPLQGRDRAYAGQAKEGGLSSFIDQGYETRPVEGGGLQVKTGWSDTAEGANQYLVTAAPAGPAACSVTFVGRARDTVDPATIVETPDWHMQLDLLRVVDPAAAARIEAAAPPK
jgi:hypothetical protein